MTTATATETETTFTLTFTNHLGTFTHRITFRPIGDMVEITERMDDAAMGYGLGRYLDRAIPIEEARAFYRKQKRHGFR